MRSLSILFTNHTLAHRAGSELWVRDVARALVARRHRPIAFSLVIGPVADELRTAGVPVVTDLANVTTVPDLIHGHHHLETLIAALQFPTVPIVHFCHGWLPWEERPLKHPSIVRYVAVDDTCAERLTVEEGISSDRIDLLFNFVDLRRFTPRQPLPDRPKRALVFSNQAREGGFVDAIRDACREEGIKLTVAGHSSGRVIERPEKYLREFDLVFAKARSALEALAVGCSVIVADLQGAGSLATVRDFKYMRARNFGLRLLQQPHSVDWYRKQIAAYDRSDATAVSALVRDSAGLDAAVDRLLEIYDCALRESVTPKTDASSIAAQQAAAQHLCKIAPALKQAHANRRQVEELTRQLAAAKGRHVAPESSVDRYSGSTVVRLRDAMLGWPITARFARYAGRLVRRFLA
jgi:hypothetical protein